MPKKLLSLILALTLALSLAVPAFAVTPEDAQEDAMLLYNLGLFKGTGTTADGSPKFDLDRAPTRAEAVTILVRLLGAEEAATQKAIATPFTDVPAWAKPYVGYAYSKGYTNGVDAKHFGPNNTVSAAQFLTFLLRALGYKDGTDFTWDSPWTLTDQLGISNGAYNAKTKTFLRADAAALSASTLYAKKKGSDKTLLKDLLDNGAISGSTVVIWDYDAVAFQKDYASFLFYPVSGSPATFTSFKLDKVTVNGLSCQTLQVTTPEAVAAYLASIGHKAGGFGYVEITYDEEAAAKAATEYYTAAVRTRRAENFRAFNCFVDAVDRRFDLSDRCNRSVLVHNLIDGTTAAAVKLLSGEYSDDPLTVHTIFETIFQPVFAILDI